MKQKTYVYTSFTDDIIKSKNQSYILPSRYQWIRSGILNAILYHTAYFFTMLFAAVYCTCILRIKIVNRDKLKSCKNTGFFLYGNHTQAVGDAFVPVWLCRGKRMYAVVSPANLGIPILGRILPYMGALPVTESPQDFKSLELAIKICLAKGKGVVIYPEAHVWPYYTKIRPFSAGSFYYPAKNAAPSFVMTTTYQKRRWGRRPKITVYVDGPFWADAAKPLKEQRKELHRQIYDCMKKQSEHSNYEYICYREE